MRHQRTRRHLRATVLTLVTATASAFALGRPVAGTSPQPPKAFDLQGHRGARGLRPENTLAAFAEALRIGVGTLELDCAVTRDGIVVVSHDPRLNPDLTRDSTGAWLSSAGPPLSTLSYAEVELFDVGRIRPGTAYAARFPLQQAVDGQRIPRLRDLFALVKESGESRVRFNVETKLTPMEPTLTPAPEAFAEALVRTVRDEGMQARTSIQSFDWRTLDVVQRIAPEIQTVCLTSQRPGDDNVEAGRSGRSPWLAGRDVDDFDGSVPRLVKASGAAIWSPNFLDVGPRAVDEAHGLGLRVVPWTVNEPEEASRLLSWGVDGLISDYPDRMHEVLTRAGRPVPSARPSTRP